MQKIEIHKVEYDKNTIPPGLTWYIIGPPKTGKTTQSAQWHADGSDKVLLVDTDLGSDFSNNANVVSVVSLRPPMIPVMKDNKQVLDQNKQPKFKIVPPKERGYTFRTGSQKGKPMPVYSMVEVVNYLKQTWDSLPFETLVIDTIDEINGWIEHAVEQEMKIGAMGEGEWGADWKRARMKNLDIIKRLQTMIKKKGGSLVLTSHSKQTGMVDNKVQLSPNLPRGLGKAISAKADIIGYSSINKKSKEHIISFVGYDERNIGSRLQALAQQVVPFNYQEVIKMVESFTNE